MAFGVQTIMSWGQPLWEWWEGGTKGGSGDADMDPNLTLCLSLLPENTKNTELEFRDFVIHLSIHLPST